MTVRYDLGDYTCRVAVSPSDTITDILNEISNFLGGKGWTRIDVQVNETTKIAYGTFVCRSLDFSQKRFVLKIMPIQAGSSDLVGVIDTQSGDGTVSMGNTDNAPTTSERLWASRFFIKLNVTNSIYIFASNRYAFFISENATYGIGGANVPTDKLEWALSYYAPNSFWDSGTPYASLGPVTDYTGPDLIVPSAYDYHDNSGYYNISGGTIFSNTQAISPATPGYVQGTNRGIIGCIEGITPTGLSFNSHFQSASMLNDFTQDDSALRVRLNIQLSRTNYHLNSVIENTKYRGQVCGLYDNFEKYRNLSFGKGIKIPWVNKNVVSDLRIRNNSPLSYLGDAFGLKVTQADRSFNESFMQEVWLKVDANFRLNPNGELKKFFVVPGGSTHDYSFPERNWVWLNENHTLGNPGSNIVSHYYFVYPGGGYSNYIVYANTSQWTRGGQIYGYWITRRAAGTYQNHSSFLIPA